MQIISKMTARELELLGKRSSAELGAPVVELEHPAPGQMSEQMSAASQIWNGRTDSVRIAAASINHGTASNSRNGA
jgi:hypothetical protein